MATVNKTYGSGGDYTDPYTALAAVTVGSDYTFTGISDCELSGDMGSIEVDTYGGSVTFDGAGFTVTVPVTMSYGATIKKNPTFGIYASLVTFKNTKLLRTNSSSLAVMKILVDNVVYVGETQLFTVERVNIYGDGALYGFLYSNNGGNSFIIKSCQVYNCQEGFYGPGATTHGSQRSAPRVVENCTIYGGHYGFRSNYDSILTPWTLRNNVIFGQSGNSSISPWSHGAYYLVAPDSLTIENCADDDGTLPPTATDSQEFITAANEFISLVDSSDDFLHPVNGATGVIGNAGKAPTYATVDLDGYAIPYAGNYPIGCHVSYVAASYDIPLFRYRASVLELNGISAPPFPVTQGDRTHVYPTDKPEYGIEGRRHATADVSWRTDSIQQTARDTIWTFWNTTLAKGYADFTAIDHRMRMLFDASWNRWIESWSKRNGGLHSISYPLESPVPWTPPVFGAFLSTTNNLESHTLTGDALALDQGTLVDFAGDANILRKNGYALKMAEITDTAASNTTVFSWNTVGEYNSSVTLFCQMRTPVITADDGVYLDVMKLLNKGLSDSIHKLSLRLTRASASTCYLAGYVMQDSSAVSVTKADTTLPAIGSEEWYDLAITYDCVNNEVFVYWCNSGTASLGFDDFLAGLTIQEDGIIGTRSNTAIVPAPTTWESLALLTMPIANTVSTAIYLQNAFVIHGFMTPLEFNTMRRLCYMWNNKTSGTWPA